MFTLASLPLCVIKLELIEIELFCICMKADLSGLISILKYVTFMILDVGLLFVSFDDATL